MCIYVVSTFKILHVSLVLAVDKAVLVEARLEIDMANIFGYEINIFIDEICGSLVCSFQGDVDEDLEGLFSLIKCLPFEELEAYSQQWR